MFNADGSYFGGEFLVNTATANEQARPALAGLTGGGFVDAFDTNSNGTGNLHISGRLFDSAGNANVNGVNISNNEFTINTTAGDERDPAVAALAGGGFVAAYVPGSGGFISARIFDSVGTPAVNGVTSNTNDFVVDSNSHFGQFAPSITALSSGGFLVTYTEQQSISGNTDVEARLFDASGNLVASNINSNTFVVGQARVANLPTTGSSDTASAGLSGGDFVITWLDQLAGITFGRLFDAGGNPVASTGGTDGNGMFQIAGVSTHQAVSSAPNGGFLVTWDSNTDIHGQLFDAGAHKIGGEFIVNTTLAGSQSDPTISALADGHIVVAWTDTSQTGGDTSGTAIKFQIIDPNAPAPPPHDSFNGDGSSDILWQNSDGTPAVWLMNGTSLVSGGNVGFDPGAAWHVVDSGDFSGDGKADILWQNTDGTVAEWFVNGTSLVSGGSVAFNPGPAWHAVATGDFNGDGKADILWQNQDGTPAVWLMNGLNILSGANVGFNPGASWHVVGTGDFNGDGKSDILWQNADGTPAIWLMNGTSLISGANVGFNPGAAWHVVGAGDFNGDGKSDILWQNTDGTVAEWFVNGTNLVSGGSVAFNPGPAWHAIGAGDFNGDGKADIQWQNDDGTPAVWLMNGLNILSGANVGFNPGASWHEVHEHAALI
jgi:hypothetical protein